MLFTTRFTEWYVVLFDMECTRILKLGKYVLLLIKNVQQNITSTAPSSQLGLGTDTVEHKGNPNYLVGIPYQNPDVKDPFFHRVVFSAYALNRDFYDYFVSEESILNI